MLNLFQHLVKDSGITLKQVQDGMTCKRVYNF